MLDQLTFEFVDSKSGQLYLYAGTYTPYTGWIQCETGRTSPFRRWRAFFNFDTSSIPDHAQIEDVTFRIRRRGDAMGAPETYALKFSLGTFIGAALDGNAGEWNGGTHLLTLDAKPADKLVVDLSDDGGDPCAIINKTGDTDLKVWDDSTQGSGDTSWETNFNKTTSERCKLYVTFSIPSGTATGVGDASGDMTVTHVLSGTATGVGDASGDMTVTRLLSGTATGVGDASGDMTVTHVLSGTATGVGDASGTLIVVHLAMAIHSGTYSIAPIHSRTVSIAPSHSARYALNPSDSRTHGARRN